MKILLLIALIGLSYSGGIHRVAQSAWNCPQKGRATSLNLYFTLDSDLPAAGYMVITLPTGAAHTPTGANVWTLTTSLDAPTKVENAGTCSISSFVMKCTFAAKLTKGTSYGVAIAGSGALAGSWGPVSLETRMNNEAVAGPVMDCNHVFDSINTAGVAPTYELSQTKKTPADTAEKKFPGETANIEWKFGFANWAATKVIKAPYNINMKLGAKAARGAGTDLAVQLYPHTYEQWTWVTTCTNTQFGINDADLTDKVGPVTLKVKTPTCAVDKTTGNLVITMVEDLKAADYSVFFMKFEIAVKMPSDFIGTGTTVDSYFSDPNSNMVHATGNQLSSFLAVTKPAGQADTDGAGLVAFGKDPKHATEIGNGVGVYSNIFCIFVGATANTFGYEWGAAFKSNCGATTVVDEIYASTPANIYETINSIEITWTLPYAIPDDRTEAEIICSTEQQITNPVAANTAAWFAQDPLRIYQSSMMTQGAGTGHCFYNGVADLVANRGKHRFYCRNMGALAKSNKLVLAFQFQLTNAGKDLVLGAASGTNNHVAQVSKKLDCEVKINTYTSETSSAVNWYQSKYSVPVDGDTQGSTSGKWQSFIVTQTAKSSIGCKDADQDMSTTGKNIEVWILMSEKDRPGVNFLNFRTMPWDTTNTAELDLFVNCYGVALKLASTLLVTMPASAKFITAKSNRKDGNDGTWPSNGQIAGLTALAAIQSGLSAGMVSFKIAKTTWGQHCCAAGGTACQGTGNGENTAPFPCNLDANLKLFAHTERASQALKQYANSIQKSDGVNTQRESMYGFKAGAIMDMPAHLTTFRGRGGFGASNQKLMDVFWALTTSAANSNAIQTLIHFYIGVVGTAKTDDQMLVNYGFPLNTFQKNHANGATKVGRNDGQFALSVGLKLYIAHTVEPLAKYYGFFVLRMIPFYKKTGGNQIDVVTNAKRAVKCWAWGSENGQGFCRLHNAVPIAQFFAGSAGYMKAKQYAAMNFVICEVGVAAGTATTGDVIIVPAKQSNVDIAGENNMLPKGPLGDAAYNAASNEGVALCSNSGGEGMGIYAGTDAMLGTMTFISGFQTTFTNVVIGTTIEGATNAASKNALPTGYAQHNDNTASTIYDIYAVTSADWVIGKDKCDALIKYKLAAAADWTTPRGLFEICSTTTGPAIPATQVMNSGKVTGAHLCTATYAYTHMDVTTTTTRKHRMCRWCTSTLDTGNVYVFMKDFVPPTTTTRKISGLTIWAAAAAAQAFNDDPTETATLQESVVIAASGCGKTGQTTKKSTKGQKVEFSIKSPVPIAYGQFVYWEEFTSTQKFQLGTIKSGSISCTCGSYTFSPAVEALSTNKILKLTMPAAPSSIALQADKTACAKGDLKCNFLEWSSSATTVTELTASCYACSVACTADESNDSGNSGKGVARYVSSVTFTMKQDGAASTDVLKVKDVMYVPNSKGAIGKFFFKPSTSMSLYAGKSAIDYTFGSQTFGATAKCMVMTSDGTKPSMIHSDLVSKCEISGSKVTVTMAKSSTANFHVMIVGMDAWLASATNKVTGNVVTYTTTVQSTDATEAKQFAMAVVAATETTASSNDVSASTTVVTVKRTLVNIMDIGMIEFSITPKVRDFGSDGLAFISFPTYYNPCIGDMMRCSLYDATKKVDGARLYCKVAWDYTLKVVGPATAQKKDAVMVLRVYGVSMNAHAAAGKFGVGLTNSTYWMSDMKLVEFKTVTDTATGVWGAKAPLDVTKIELSSSTVRSSTDITMEWNLLATTDTVTNGADYVAIQLPYQWMGVCSWADGTAKPSMKLSLATVTGTGTAAKTTWSEVKGTVTQVAGSYAVYTITTGQTVMAEGKKYKLVVSGVPTAWHGASAKAMNLGSMVLSVGKAATGGTGHSSAQLFTKLKSQVPKAGINLLEFKNQMVTVSRGTYTKNAVCIKAAEGNLKTNVAAKPNNAAFKTNPASVSASMGDKEGCASMGTASTTQMSTHNVYWTVENGTSHYTQLPTMMVTVNGNKGTVTVPDAVTCSLGGSSFPILVTSDVIPFANVAVSLTTSIAADEKKTDNSVGITPNAGETVTLKIGAEKGVLGFKCAATVTGKELKYKLDGTDKAQFALSATVIAVTAVKAGTKPATAPLTIAMVAAESKSAETTVTGLCPGLGNSWIQFAPYENKATILKTSAEVAAAAKLGAKGKGAHEKEQWCSNPIVKTTDLKSKCKFATASNRKYTASLYCDTMEGWFFGSAKATNVTAKDNGGKPVTMTLTYKKAISDITDNAIVLSICGKIAENLAVPYARVTDAYGGYYGKPSPTLPGAAPKAATGNTTANATKRYLANATANKTAAPSEYKISMFVQPDPFAEKVDNKATITSVKGSAITTAIDALTKTKYGAMTVTAAEVSEKAVKWVKKPAATGGAKKIDIAGSTDVGAYVYCAVSKTASSRRMLADNASNATAAPAPAKKEVLSLQSASTADKYSIKRSETKTGALSFAFSFASLGEGKTYSWMCEATSLSPSNPAFRTTLESGSSATSAAPVVVKGDSALWSSLFAAVLMIAAVFFY